MSIEFTYLEPNVLLATQKPPFSPEDVKAMQVEIANNSGKHPYFFVISDLREVNLTFGDIVEGMAQSIDGSTGYSAGDEGVELVMVTSDETNKLLADFYKQERYGAMEMGLATTIDEARAYVAKRKAAIG